MNAAAATVSRFQDGHLLARARKLSSGHQAGSPRADDQDMGWTSRSHRSPRSLTGMATPWPKTIMRPLRAGGPRAKRHAGGIVLQVEGQPLGGETCGRELGHEFRLAVAGDAELRAQPAIAGEDGAGDADDRGERESRSWRRSAAARRCRSRRRRRAGSRPLRSGRRPAPIIAARPPAAGRGQQGRCTAPANWRPGDRSTRSGNRST